jgi:hypothetical protein
MPSLSDVFEGARRVNQFQESLTYSICTLVTDASQYSACLKTFHAQGFVEPDCEFLFIDNANGNEFDAFAGLNLFLRRARGRYIILCHQDIRLIGDGRERLDALLAELDPLDPKWGLCGNAGGLHGGGVALRITDPINANARVGGPFPARCESLDENFIVVRAAANLALSSDCQGFHHYGTDLCVIADILGYRAYVIDFHLQHLSDGDDGPGFHEMRRSMIRKYRRALRPRLIETTNTTMPLTSSAALSLIARSGKGMNLWRWFLRQKSRPNSP